MIGIKDGPVEIWDLKSMSMLSKMSKRFPSPVCMVNILRWIIIKYLIKLLGISIIIFLIFRNGFNVTCQKEKEVV